MSKRNYFRDLVKRNIPAFIGFTILLLFVLIAFFAPLVAPFNPNKTCDVPYLRPSVRHLLGTNDIGQDIFSEMVYGTRVSLSIGVLSSLFSTGVGVILGLFGGYFGGKTDKVICALIDIMMSIPSVPLTMVLVAFLGGSAVNMIVIIGITSWVGPARIVRSKVLQLRDEPFIKIERAIGAGNFRIFWSHLLPNLADIILTRFSMAVGSGMTMESSLSFLGLGNYGEKSWGNVLHYAFYNGGLMKGYYWWYLPPIICISLSMLAFLLISSLGSSREGLSLNRKKEKVHAGN